MQTSHHPSRAKDKLSVNFFLLFSLSHFLERGRGFDLTQTHGLSVDVVISLLLTPNWSTSPSLSSFIRYPCTFFLQLLLPLFKLTDPNRISLCGCSTFLSGNIKTHPFTHTCSILFFPSFVRFSLFNILCFLLINQTQVSFTLTFHRHSSFFFSSCM